MIKTKDVYIPGIKPGKLRNGKVDNPLIRHQDRTQFCLEFCPHPNKPCNGPCAEFRHRFKVRV